MYDYGLIGNCQTSALISRAGSVDWLCWPRPDSPPVFGRLLDEAGGQFVITPSNPFTSSQAYVENTNVLETTFTLNDGESFKVIDFFPRFGQYGRMYRPLSLFRLVIPLVGSPEIQVTCQPVNGWSKRLAPVMRGNSHIRFDGFSDQLRLTTNMPLTHLIDGIPKRLVSPLYFCLSWGAPLEDDIAQVATHFLNKTIEYWRTWVKHLSIPTLFQKEVIRSALTLKMHCFEETGAILAAVTTSLPEIWGHTRNWDYRFCWLRDAYFTVSALYQLGHFEEMEGILSFLFEILENADLRRLHPVYRIDGTLPLPENEMPVWSGFQKSNPVREGNQAAEHVQNDVYGEMLLTLTPIYFDDRFSHLRNEKHDRMLKTLAERCFDTLDEPDAGLWELRSGWKVHTFTLLMSWAGLERYERIVKLGLLREPAERATQWREAAAARLMGATVNGTLTSFHGSPDFDAALLLLPMVRYPVADVVEATVTRIRSELALAPVPGEESPSSFFYRYRHEDDFGRPAHAFLICSFWMVEALAKLGRQEEALKILTGSLKAGNSLGLFAEHFDPALGLQTGNFPQCYSHVGLIHAAFAVSPPWDRVL